MKLKEFEIRWFKNIANMSEFVRRSFVCYKLIYFNTNNKFMKEISIRDQNQTFWPNLLFSK